MSRRSAGLLMYREGRRGIEVLLAHPGGPFFRNKDEGAWSIPKGLLEGDDEDELAAARREFREETGCPAQADEFLELGSVRQQGGKTVLAWAFRGDWDPAQLESDVFGIEWPPGSGTQRTFPEIDRAEFFSLDEARRKINPAQAAFLDRLVEILGEMR